MTYVSGPICDNELVKYTFLKFSIIRRKFDTTNTNAMRFLKPRKLGVAVESWLRHDVLAVL